MNLYGNEKDRELKLRIGTGDNFSYQELLQFQQDGLLEDFDSFDISSDFNNKLCVYYNQGQYYLITQSHNIKPIDISLLNGRQIVVASRSITNNVQHYLQLHGQEAFDKLNKNEIINIIKGFEYKPEQYSALDDIMQELSER